MRQISEEEGLLAVAAWPSLSELVLHNNPLTLQTSGDPPLLKRYLHDRLGIHLQRFVCRHTLLLCSTVENVSSVFKRIETYKANQPYVVAVIAAVARSCDGCCLCAGARRVR